MYKQNTNNLAFEVRMPNGVWQTYLPIVTNRPELIYRRLTPIASEDGKQIKEGDIIEFEMATEFGSFIPCAGVMVWHDCDASFVIALFTRNTVAHYFRGGNKLKIVGNIWDNPEKVTELTERFGAPITCNE